MLINDLKLLYSINFRELNWSIVHFNYESSQVWTFKEIHKINRFLTVKKYSNFSGQKIFELLRNCMVLIVLFKN